MNLIRIHFQFDGYCVYCGMQTKLEPEPGERRLAATRDHLIPVSAGGKKCEKNEVLACEACNKKKDALDPRTLMYLWNERDPEGFDVFVARLKDGAAAMREAKANSKKDRKRASRGVVAAFAAKAAFLTVGRYLT